MNMRINPVQPSGQWRRRLCRFIAGPTRTHDEQEAWRYSKDVPGLGDCVFALLSVCAIAVLAYVCLSGFGLGS